MDSNSSLVQNGTTNNESHSTNPDIVISPSRQLSISDSLLDGSDLTDEADLETMRKRIHEMEAEAEKLKEMQLEVEKQMQLPNATGTSKLADISVDFTNFYLVIFFYYSTLSNN